MTERRRKRLLLMLMLVPLVATGVALLFLPVKIPYKLDAAGNVTAWYTSFMLLLVPGLGAGMGLFTLDMLKRADKLGQSGPRLMRMAFISGLLSLVVFAFVTAYSIYAAFVQAAVIR